MIVAIYRGCVALTSCASDRKAIEVPLIARGGCGTEGGAAGGDQRNNRIKDGYVHRG